MLRDSETEYQQETVGRKLSNMLYQHGVWPEEVKEIMEDFAEQEGNDGVKFNNPQDSYPPQVFAVLNMGLKKLAVSKLKETKPHHFAIEALEG